MRLLVSIFLFFALTACQVAAPSIPATEGEIAEEAEQLIRYSLTDRLLQDTETYYRNQIRSMFPAGDDSAEQANQIIDEELQKLLLTEHERLIDGLVPIYLRFFTAEEIHQLLSFYKTEVARKSLRVSSQIAVESRQFVRLWSENFGHNLLSNIDSRLTAAGISINR